MITVKVSWRESARRDSSLHVDGEATHEEIHAAVTAHATRMARKAGAQVESLSWETVETAPRIGGTFG